MIATATEFEFLRDLVFDRASIVLTEDKEYLFEARLKPVARSLGFGAVTDMIRTLQRSPDPDVETRVIDAMTTNETSWFRDVRPFEALRQVVFPDSVARNAERRRLSVWSAASSSGQELYSIAMMLCDEFPEVAGWNVDLLGTDLCTEMVARAREGRFSGLEVNRGLPAAKLVRHFARDGAHYRICDELRRRVRFETFNLAKPWPPMPCFDVILLRNVLIYFDVPTKRSVLESARRQLAHGGYLVLGGAESTHGLVDGLVPVNVAGTTIYKAEER